MGQKRSFGRPALDVHTQPKPDIGGHTKTAAQESRIIHRIFMVGNARGCAWWTAPPAGPPMPGNPPHYAERPQTEPAGLIPLEPGAKTWKSIKKRALAGIIRPKNEH